MVNNLICLSMNFEQLKSGIVLALSNIKGNFNEVCNIGDIKGMMNGRSGSFDSGFGWYFLLMSG